MDICYGRQKLNRVKQSLSQYAKTQTLSMRNNKRNEVSRKQSAVWKINKAQSSYVMLSPN